MTWTTSEPQICKHCKKPGARLQDPSGGLTHYRCRTRPGSPLCAVCRKGIKGMIRYWLDPEEKRWAIHRKCRPIPAGT